MSYSKQEAYNGIKELVEKFKNNYSQFHSSEYNETLTRQDFINPFFEFLGWDISNKQGYSQSYREVIHEDKIKTGKDTGKRQAPDYSFRIGGNRVFFVEAKKPSRNLKEDSESAYQIRRYAWSGKLGISVLTDFEEFAIYDCSKKPSPNDKASMSRIEYINYEDYLERFDFLYDTFAKESVLKGSLEKYNADAKSKRGTESVDIDFLNSLDNLRTKLASNISKLNNNLSERDLNFAVQHIIDRIIFLRVAEDRGVENYGDLIDACDKQGTENNCYKNIVEIFKKADGKYNSGLFDFSYDKITANIEAENKVIKEIINDLYYPKSPYEFSIIPIEIIGKAYEQFLGKTITIGNNHKAKIELKPEVRKAGGVYYTPEYIVDYIVENTVGEKIKGLTPEKIEKIKIVDPACGSGSFLLGAYKYLLNYHREYYLKSSDNKLKGYKENKRENIIKENGELALWIKKRILRNNIFGVDIDSNAVEVTKLSLLLKCMEGETSASIMDNQSLFNERALPSLDDNIKCGNSLIGSDFYSNQNMLNIDMETQYKINSFDWDKEFVEAFKKGGFDVVIGNPPYEITLGKRTKKERYILENENEYYKNKYINIQGEINLYKVFSEKMTKLINKYGAVGVIMPTGILTDKSNLNLRNYILDNFSSLQINHFPEKAKVFKNVTQDVSVYIISNNNNLITLKNNLMNDYELNCTKPIVIPKKIITRLEKVPLINDKKEIVLLNKLCNYKTFNETKLVSFIEGEIHLTKFKEAIKRNKTSKNTFDLVRGDSVRRYLFIKSDKDSFIDGSIVKKISSSPKLNDINSIRLIYQHITNIQMNRRLIFQLLDTKKYIANSCGYVINKSDYNIKYFLALLNSKLLNWRYKITSSNNNILTNELYNLPVPILYLSKKSDKEIHDKLVNLVENIINLNKKLANENNPNTMTILKRQIAAIDDEIDKIVYKLYGLTKEEIRIVEGE